MPIVPIAAGERGTGEGHEETNQTRGYDTHDDHTRHTVWRQEEMSGLEMGFISHWALCPLPRSQPRLCMEKERSGQLASQNVTTDGSSTSPADLHSRTWPVENRIPHVVREAVKGQGGTRFDDRDRNRIGMNNHGSYIASERERTPPPTYSVLARGLSASQRRDGGKKSHQSRSPLLARASALFFSASWQAITHIFVCTCSDSDRSYSLAPIRPMEWIGVDARTAQWQLLDDGVWCDDGRWAAGHSRERSSQRTNAKGVLLTDGAGGQWL